jgi:hypothetical protein
MIDPLTIALLYAILKVCEGVSINLLSSTVFESFKDKIFKKKGKSEKELLKDAIQELKKSDIGSDILKEITEKEDEILSVSFEYYSEISKDTAEIKRLSELLNEKMIEVQTTELLTKVQAIELSKGKNANQDDSKEGEITSTSKVAYSDPQMIEISLYEIKTFLITENVAKVILLAGTLFLGGILSAVLSDTPVHLMLIILSIALLVFGLILDGYLIYTKFTNLERRGAGKWH